MKIFIWALGIILIIFALASLGGSGSKIEPPFEAGVVHPLDHIKGSASSTLVVMEYSDFQCPACRSYYPIIREVMAEFGDKVTFVYRHFPLTNAHPNAEFAARAAEAAGKQGKFWEMHDLLFEKQNEWASVADILPLFESYATLLSLSLEQFKTDFASEEVKDFVTAQKLNALQSGLPGTPTFFVDGKEIQNPNSALEFKGVITNALRDIESN